MTNKKSKGKFSAVDFEAAYKMVGRSAIYLVGISMVLNVFFSYQWYVSVKENGKVVYFSGQQGAFQATKADGSVKDFDVKNIGRDFVEHLFSWNQNTYNANVERARWLAYKDVTNPVVADFNENDYKDVLVNNDLDVRMELVESSLNMDVYPYELQLVYKRHQDFRQAGQVQTTKFEVVLEVENYDFRSETNPYGLVISGFTPYEKPFNEE